MALPEKENSNDLFDSIDLTKPEFDKFVKELYALAGYAGSSEQVTGKNLMDALRQVKKKVPDTGRRSRARVQSKHECVMIIGLLGIINYQLKTIVKGLGYTPVIVKTVEDAVAEFQQNDYTKIIIDLYMPTEVEGFEAIDEIKKIALICNLKFNIIVLSNPSESHLESATMARGANCFLVRSDKWQERLADYIEDPNPPYFD